MSWTAIALGVSALLGGVSEVLGKKRTNELIKQKNKSAKEATDAQNKFNAAMALKRNRENIAARYGQAFGYQQGLQSTDIPFVRAEEIPYDKRSDIEAFLGGTIGGGLKNFQAFASTASAIKELEGIGGAKGASPNLDKAKASAFDKLTQDVPTREELYKSLPGPVQPPSQFDQIKLREPPYYPDPSRNKTEVYQFMDPYQLPLADEEIGRIA